MKNLVGLVGRPTADGCIAHTLLHCTCICHQACVSALKWFVYRASAIQVLGFTFLPFTTIAMEKLNGRVKKVKS